MGRILDPTTNGCLITSPTSEHPAEHALVGASAFYRTSDGNGDRFFGPVTRKPMEFESPDQLISTLNFFTTSASMVRRDAALAVGGFRQWWGAEDFDLWVRVLERYTGICSRRVTVFYQVHDAQLSLQADRMLHEHRQVLKSHLERTGNSPAMLERWEATVAWDRLRAEQAAGRWRGSLQYVRGPDMRTPTSDRFGIGSSGCGSRSADGPPGWTNTADRRLPSWRVGLKSAARFCMRWTTERCETSPGWRHPRPWLIWYAVPLGSSSPRPLPRSLCSA